MIPEITDKNLYLLLPGKVAAVVEQYVDDHRVCLFLMDYVNSTIHLLIENQKMSKPNYGIWALLVCMKSLWKRGSYGFEIWAIFLLVKADQSHEILLVSKFISLL